MLGRNTSSVFPKEAEKAKKEQLESIKKAVGLDSSRFITESQVSFCKQPNVGRCAYCPIHAGHASQDTCYEVSLLGHNQSTTFKRTD